jgi:dienelactone hydrolase
MGRRCAVGWILVSLSVAALLGGCAAGTTPSRVPATPTPASIPSAPVAPTTPSVTAPATAPATPTPSVPASPTPTPSVVATYDLAYESTNPVLVPGELDVYAPAEAGPWPVVVMFHGAPGSSPKLDRSELAEHARKLADLGFVVFNASWGHATGGSAAAPDRAGLLAVQAEAACAVEFARAHAAEYGGDPSTMVVFGHSGGAHPAVMATFARPKPAAGCLGGATLGPIDALVTWEGNWLLSVNYPDWDAALAADPKVMDAVTPWSYLADHKDQKVVMLVSENPGALFVREVGDPSAADSWLDVRDPSGALRKQLQKAGAFTDGKLDFVEVQQLLYSVLKAQGNPVSLDTMPDSTHTFLSEAGWKVFLAAFSKAAAKGR